MEIFDQSAHRAVGEIIGVARPTVSRVEDQRQHIRDFSKRSLYYFTTAVLGWNKLRPNPHKGMAEFLQDTKRRRKVLLVPRDTFKSTIAAKSLPLWIVIQDEIGGLPGPEHRILLASHSSENASKHLRSIKQQVERNEILTWAFPELIPDGKGKWTDSNLQFPRQGTYGEDTIESAGVDTHIVSRHYTVEIKDDLEDQQSFESPAVRTKVKNWYRAAEALFVSEQDALDYIVGTRWGTDDLYQEIQTNESEDYAFLCRPLHWTRELIERDNFEAEKHNRKPVYEMDPIRDAPDPTKTYFFFEELFPEASCQRLRRKLGSFMYSMLYMNNPYDDSMREFKREWLRECWWTTEGDICYEQDGQRVVVPFDSLHRVQVWDPALSEKDQKKNCRNAIACAGRDRNNNIFLFAGVIARVEPTKLLDKFIGFHQRFALHRSCIEDAGFQRILKFPLYNRMQQLEYTFPVHDQPATQAKEVRIRALIPYAENGQFFIIRGLLDFREEFENFPLFPTRDGADAAAGCLEQFGKARRVQDVDDRFKRRSSAQEQLRLASRSTRTGY